MRHWIVGSLLLLGTATSAYAAGNWYVVGAVSRSSAKLDAGALDAALTGSGATGLTSGQSGVHGQWRLQLGYKFNPYFALEGGYIDLGKRTYNATFTGGSATVDWKSGGIDLAALGTLPLGDGISLLGKVGLIDAKTTGTWSSTGLAGAPSGKVTKSAWRPFVGVGASYALTKRTSLRAEYERFNGIGDGSRTGKANVNVVSVGVRYDF